MSLFIAQILVLVYLLAYVVVFLYSLIWVKNRGKDPKGTTHQYGRLAEFSSFFTFLWLLIMLLYSFLPDFFIFMFPFSFLISEAWIICGLVIIAIGFVLETVGMFTLGENFRIAFPKEETTLITHGIYGIIRNPIVLSVFLFVIGTFLVCPNLLTLVNLVGTLITFNAKATDEEKFLAERFDSEWIAYIRHSGKYLPIFSRESKRIQTKTK